MLSHLIQCRKNCQKQFNKIENELNKTAECDNNAFWNIINQRKRKSNVKKGKKWSLMA